MGMNPVTESQNGTNITATATIFTGPCSLLGIFVSSASATPTIKVGDAAVTKANTFTPVAATWYPIPITLNTSLVVTISGTVDCCVVWH